MAQRVRTIMDRIRRRAAGRPVKTTLVLIVFMALAGHLRLLLPYDWFQQALTAQINARAYNGDITIVDLDDKTREKFGRPGLDPLELGRLLKILDRGEPKQIVVDRLPRFDSQTQNLAPLLGAIDGLSQRPYFWVDVVPFDEAAARGVTVEGSRKFEARYTIVAIAPELARRVNLSSWVTWSTPIGAPWGLPRTMETTQGTILSLTQVLAGHFRPISDGLLTDLSIDPATIPRLSAADLLGGSINPRKLAGRRVLISSTGDLLQDAFVTPHGPSTPRGDLIVMGAQTIAEGPPHTIQWLPAFMVGMAAALGWLLLPKWTGRLLALSSLVVIAASPIVLERYSIYQETSVAVFLLLFVGLAHLISSARSALALARSAAETKSWFLAQASHDLRQPIHAIGMLAARLGNTELTPTQSDLVDKIDRSVEGASRMFQSLLDIATIESGSLKPVFGPVSVNDLLSDIEGQNALAAERAGVELRFVPSELTLLTDRSLALTMLQNVVANAIKYASGKRVLVGCRKRGGTATLCVYDRGEGIAREDLQQVTKAFFRVERGTAGADGAGLGLAIVHRLAHMLHQRFDIRSRPGHGTGATMSGFRLTDTPIKPAAIAAAAAVQSPLTGMRVLLVDDDIVSLKATEALLTQWGCEVTAQDAFPVQVGKFDAVVSDFDFGHGKTLAASTSVIRELTARGVSLAVISGHSADVVRKALGQDDALVIAKPVRPAHLRSVLMAAKVRS